VGGNDKVFRKRAVLRKKGIVTEENWRFVRYAVWRARAGGSVPRWRRREGERERSRAARRGQTAGEKRSSENGINSVRGEKQRTERIKDEGSLKGRRKEGGLRKREVQEQTREQEM
jgi:hypothetical protein